MEVLDAQYIAGGFDTKSIPASSFAEVAFAGRSNVGKSSLINALVHRKKLVRTSATPGCTRGIQIFRVKLADAVIDFADLPGYGFAKRSKVERRSWGPLIENYLSTREGLRAVVIIVDIRRGVEPDDVELVEFLEHYGRKAIVVATKIDKVSKSERKPMLEKIAKDANRRILGFSSESEEGRDQLWKVLLKAAAIEQK